MPLALSHPDANEGQKRIKQKGRSSLTAIKQQSVQMLLKVRYETLAKANIRDRRLETYVARRPVLSV